jgi:hypothetical protein
LTVEKGQLWGEPGPLPPDGVVVRRDAEARRLVEAARRRKEPPPVLGLLGGDLARTLGAPGNEARLHSAEAMTFRCDLGAVLIDGKLHWFVAHAVARNRPWTRAFAAMNAEWIGHWDVAPRSHPGDGLLDVLDARLRLGELAAVARRLRTGSHLPHPRIKTQRVAAVQAAFERPLDIWLDGERVSAGRSLSIRLEPDALTVVV